jgi:hypothetical protein
MKLIDAVGIKQGRFEIPDCSRTDLPGFFREMGYKTGAEIGVFKGRFSALLCGVGLRVFSIDPWLLYVDWNEKKGWPKDLQEEQDGFYKIAKWRLNRYKRSTIIRKTSMEAVKEFKDNSLDFVYIDGHHGFKYVAEDIFEWSKKVRVGGIISGHDYINRSDWTCHVRYIVDAYVQAFGIKNWYILGSENPQEGEKADIVRSWMWVKE